MTAPDPHRPDRHETRLPTELRDQLDQFRSQLWRVKIIEAVLAGFFGVLFSFLLVFALDRFVETPGLVRLGILIGGVSLFVFFAPFLLRRWVWGHRHDSQLARLISQKYPNLGDRLLGVVELRSQKADSESLSPALRDAAMRNVTREAKQRDIQNALPISRQGRWGLIVAGLFAVALAALIIEPQAAKNSVKRWLMPLSDTARFTYTELEDAPESLIVPHGEAFPLDLQLTAGSARVPEFATAAFPDGKEIRADLAEGNRYNFLLPGQRKISTLSVKVGDVFHQIRIEPKVRPSITGLSANVAPPAYLRSSSRELDIQGGYLSVVAGSSLEIEGTSSRPLRSLTLTPRAIRGTADEEPTNDDLTLAAPWDGPVELTPASSDFALPALPLGSESIAVTASWVDEFGLSGSSDFTLTIDALADEPPSVYAQGVERQVVILAKETINFTALVEDDFGLKEVGIEWLGTHTRPTAEPTATGELTLDAPRPGSRRTTREVAFSPQAYGISPQRVDLRVWATDDYPGRERSYSQPVVIYILTLDEHAQLLRNRLDRLMAGLEDAARREQDQLDANDMLGRESTEELQSEENQKKLREQTAREGDSERRMKELAEQMDDLFRDALRNDDLDEDTLKELAETNQNMQELAEEDIPGVREKLEESADERNTPKKSESDLDDAIERQKSALAKMRETIEKANDANKRLEASTFVNRLRRAAKDQAGVGASLAGNVESLGRTTDSLTLSDQGALTDIRSQQATLATDVRWIREDLLSYYNRTKKEEHKTMHDKMASSGIDSAMLALQQSIAANHSFHGMVNARKWAEQLNEWAGGLEQSLGGGGGGGGGGGQQGGQGDFEFMLRVMKMIQSEQDLRARTRALEQMRRDQIVPRS